jgi:REP element-mobilizing transposase RayT
MTISAKTAISVKTAQRAASTHDDSENSRQWCEKLAEIAGMSTFNGRYRIPSSRRPGWDYTSGWYFVTICTAHHQCWLSQVESNTVQLSPIGTIVAEEWQRTATIRPSVTIDTWIVMPNHIHAIIGIGAAHNGISKQKAQRAVARSPSRPSVLRAGSLGAIIGQFKSVATKRIWAAGFTDFGWQTRFYDTIIRDERMLGEIQAYIIANPSQWANHHERMPDLWM